MYIVLEFFYAITNNNIDCQMYNAFHQYDYRPSSSYRWENMINLKQCSDKKKTS